MLFSFALLYIQGQNTAPLLLPGTSSAFQSAVLAVEERLAAKDWEGARAKLARVPRPEMKVLWDDSHVASEKRAVILEMRDEAIRKWRDYFPKLKPHFVASGKADLKFSFEKLLAPGESGLPAGLALFFSGDPAEPEMEAVIGLRRGNPSVATTPSEVFNEVAFSFGAYLGVASSPFVGSFMGRTDQPGAGPAVPDLRDIALIRSNQEAVATLERLVQKKVAVEPSMPKSQVQPKHLELSGPITQGEKPEFSLQVSNTGNAPLIVTAYPDCACVGLTPQQTIAPGSTGIIRGRVDTTEFSGGSMRRRLFILSNDVERPLQELPMTLPIAPRYRFVSPTGPNILFKGGKAEFDVFLYTPPASPLRTKDVRVDGLPGTAEISPWSGTLADPELGEPEKLRSGYKIHVALNQVVQGRMPSTVVVTTDDPTFPILRYTVYAQSGIVALPDRLFLGELGTEPMVGSFLLSRPRQPFKVLGIRSDSPYLRAIVQKGSGSAEQKVSVRYNGKAPKGDFQAVLMVHTDDPERPDLPVTVQAIVR